ncbi:MAG: hypothetical protein ACK4ND_07640 [Cytophagaceae bacterium]
MSKIQLIIGAVVIIILILAGVVYRTIHWGEGLILTAIIVTMLPFLIKLLQKIPRRDKIHRINDEDNYGD